LELLIYIAISAGVLLSVVSLISSTLNARLKFAVTSNLEQNARFAMTTMVNKIRTGIDLEVVDQNTLSIDVLDAQIDPIVFDVQNGVLYVQEGTDPAVALTGNDVVVGDILFEDKTTPSSAKIVKITLSLDTPEIQKSAYATSSYDLQTFIGLRNAE